MQVEHQAPFVDTHHLRALLQAQLVVALHAQLPPLVRYLQNFPYCLPPLALLLGAGWLAQLKLGGWRFLLLLDVLEAEDEDVELQKLFAEGD